MQSLPHWNNELLRLSPLYRVFPDLEEMESKERLDTLEAWLQSEDYAAIAVVQEWYLRLRLDRWQGAFGEGVDRLEAQLLAYGEKFLRGYGAVAESSWKLPALHTALSILGELSRAEDIFGLVEEMSIAPPLQKAHAHCFETLCAMMRWVLLPIDKVEYYAQRISEIVWTGKSTHDIVRAWSVLPSETPAKLTLQWLSKGDRDPLKVAETLSRLIRFGSLPCRKYLLRHHDTLIAQLTATPISLPQQGRMENAMREIQQVRGEHDDFLAEWERVKSGIQPISLLAKNFQYSIYGGEDLELVMIEALMLGEEYDALQTAIIDYVAIAENTDLLWAVGGWVSQQDPLVPQIGRWWLILEKAEPGWREFLKDSKNRPPTYWHQKYEYRVTM
ncbi:MAG: hypothetical protein RLZZ519_1909 [Bacteroidota bacterium]|jgi:hypothetical protein